MRECGFILQPTYRIEQGRPVVHLFGRLESGRTFLARDTSRVPRFFVRAADASRARALGALPLAPSGRRDFLGESVVTVEAATPADVPPLRDRLHAAGIATYEADVRFAMGALIDRGIRGSVEIRGEARREEGADPSDPAAPRSPGGRAAPPLVFDDPELRPADWSPALDVLSFDIETDPNAQHLLAISLHGCGASEVLLLTPAGAACPEGAVPFPGERDLLRGFERRVRELDPDVLLGWNVVDFDLAVLLRIAGRFGASLEIGRVPGATRRLPARAMWGSAQASIPGRVVLDGIHLLRGAFIRMEDYSLDAVSREVLGEGKTITGGGRAGEILRLFEEDRARFVAYSRTDARLALEIVQKLRLVELSVERSRLTGMPIDRVSSSIAAFDFLYLSELGKRRIVAPTVRVPRAPRGGTEAVGVGGLASVEEPCERLPLEESPARVESGGGAVTDDDPSSPEESQEVWEPTTGGYVLEPETGLWRNVLVFDFKSLYPSLIRTFQIDPLGRLPGPSAGDDPIVAPNGAAFRREPGILPSILDALFPRREAAKRSGDLVAANAIKILMNSCYGVLGTPACRFHSPDIANAITGFGRELLLWSKRQFEVRGYKVLYGDTDSLFVLSGLEEASSAQPLGRRLSEEVNRELSAHVRERWRVESRLELEFETLYLRLLLPSVRHGTAGARKRYAGLVAEDGAARVVFTGMEVVRRDWTDLARRVQKELYARLFADQPVGDYLRAVVRELREGRLDGLLVYRKSLRKDPDAYTATTPPHVAAARRMVERRGRLIAYVITTVGAEPVTDARGRIDHEHYVQKQIRPVAEPVLALLGQDFDRVVGDDRQLELF